MMLGHLFTVAASLTVTACVMQPGPGYWASPYTQTYYPYSVPRGWNAPPNGQVPYSPVQQAAYMPRPDYDPPRPASDMSAAPEADANEPSAVGPEPVAYPSQPQAQPDRDTAVEAGRPYAAFAEETVDYGIPPTNTLHLHDFDAPTPTRVDGAHTVTTVELRRMMTSASPPVLIDVIGGAQTVSLPNAVWLRDAGVGRHLDDDVQAWLDLHLSRLTGHDKSRPLVFFCASRMCWLAHNATLRALDLGYTNVHWYRGGRDSWQAAGLPMTPVAPPPVDD